MHTQSKIQRKLVEISKIQSQIEKTQQSVVCYQHRAIIIEFKQQKLKLRNGYAQIFRFRWNLRL